MAKKSNGLTEARKNEIGHLFLVEMVISVLKNSDGDAQKYWAEMKKQISEFFLPPLGISAEEAELYLKVLEEEVASDMAATDAAQAILEKADQSALVN